MDKTTLQNAFVSYDHMAALKGRVKLVHGYVSALNLESKFLTVAVNGTDLESRLQEQIPFDYVVLATGANYSEPFRFNTGTVEHSEQLKRKVFERGEAVRAAKKVVIVGGGSTGVEVTKSTNTSQCLIQSKTAAEIKFAFPDKPVTLVHRGSRLLTGELTESQSAKVLKKLAGCLF